MIPLLTREAKTFLTALTALQLYLLLFPNASFPNEGSEICLWRSVFRTESLPIKQLLQELRVLIFSDGFFYGTRHVQYNSSDNLTVDLFLFLPYSVQQLPCQHHIEHQQKNQPSSTLRYLEQVFQTSISVLNISERKNLSPGFFRTVKGQITLRVFSVRQGPSMLPLWEKQRQ